MPKGFQKGNNLGRKATKAREENRKKAFDILLTAIRDDLPTKYLEMLQSLACGKELSKPKMEFLDRYDGWREFVAPKRARVDKKGDTANTTINIVKYDDK